MRVFYFCAAAGMVSAAAVCLQVRGRRHKGSLRAKRPEDPRQLHHARQLGTLRTLALVLDAPNSRRVEEPDFDMSCCDGLLTI